MKVNQINRGKSSRVMYVENKDGDLDGVAGRIGWVTFSQTGLSVYYRGRTLTRGSKGGSNHMDVATGERFWISGIKKRGSNEHRAESIRIAIDEDARDEYLRLRAGVQITPHSAPCAPPPRPQQRGRMAGPSKRERIRDLRAEVALSDAVG